MKPHARPRHVRALGTRSGIFLKDRLWRTEEVTRMCFWLAEQVLSLCVTIGYEAAPTFAGGIALGARVLRLVMWVDGVRSEYV